MNNETNKISQIIDYIRESPNQVFVTEISLYFIFFKYIELQNEKERVINIDSFPLGKFYKSEKPTEEIKKIVGDGIENLIKVNQHFFNKEFQDGFKLLFTELLFEKENYSAFQLVANAIEQIDSIHLLVRIFELLLSQHGGRFHGEFGGNGEIHKIISKILNITDGKVYDPACGSGQLLVEIQKNANNLNSEKRINFFGREINKFTYGLAKLNFYIHNLSGDLGIGDTFGNDISESIGRFDYAVVEPPLGMKMIIGRLHSSVLDRYSIKKSDFDQLWLEYITDSLNNTGKGVILLPLSSTFKKAGYEKRKRLATDGLIDSIILLPKGCLKPFTSLEVVLWVINKQKTNQEIFFIDGRELSSDEILGIQNSRSEIQNQSKTVKKEDILKYDFNLNPGVHVNGIEKEIKNYSEDKKKMERRLKKATSDSIPKEFLEGLSEDLQLLIKKGKAEGTISYQELAAVIPNVEDNLDFLDEMFTRILKLNIEVIDSEAEIEYEQELPELKKDIEFLEREAKMKRTNDEFANTQKLKTTAFYIVVGFLALETILIFLFFLFTGIGILKYNQVDLNIFIGATIGQITAIFYWIIKHLFPNKDSAG